MSALSARVEERGWAVVPGAVDARGVRRLRRAFDRVLPPSDQPAVRQRPGGAQADGALRDWLFGGLLTALARDALGCDAVQLLQDVLLDKPARAGGRIDWHCDAWYTGYLDPSRVVSIRLALDSEEPGSGGLEVLDASHRWPPAFERVVSADALPAGARRLLPERLRQTPPTPVLLQPGDVSVHLGQTWHRSGPNHAEHRRRTIVTHVFDARLRVRAERIPTGLRGRLSTNAQGHLDAGVFPLL